MNEFERDQKLDGTHLKTRRLELGLSLNGIAAQSGIAKPTVFQFEEDMRAMLPLYLLDPLSEAYRMSAAEVLLKLYKLSPRRPEVRNTIRQAEAQRIGEAVLSLSPAKRKEVLRFLDF